MALSLATFYICLESTSVHDIVVTVRTTHAMYCSPIATFQTSSASLIQTSQPENQSPIPTSQPKSRSPSPSPSPLSQAIPPVPIPPAASSLQQRQSLAGWSFPTPKCSHVPRPHLFVLPHCLVEEPQGSVPLPKRAWIDHWCSG